MLESVEGCSRIFRLSVVTTARSVTMDRAFSFAASPVITYSELT